jgi:hypothetical protein
MNPEIGARRIQHELTPRQLISAVYMVDVHLLLGF